MGIFNYSNHPITSPIGNPFGVIKLDPVRNILLSLIVKYGVPGLILDNQSVFTDAAGTLPAGVGDVAGNESDKSGGGHNLSQSVTASKPILRVGPLLEFDGTDDFMSLTDPFTGREMTLIWCGKFSSVYSSTRAILSFADTVDNNNNMYIRRDSDTVLRCLSIGTIGVFNVNVTIPSGATIVDKLYTLQTKTGEASFDVAGNSNSVVPSTEVDYSPSDTFAIGALVRVAAGLQSDTDHRYLFAINKYLDAAELLQAQQYIANLCGVTL